MAKRLLALILIVFVVCNISLGVNAASMKEKGKDSPSVKNGRYYTSEMERFEEYSKINFGKLKESHSKKHLSESDLEIKQKIEEYLNAVAQYKNFHGAVLVQKEGRIILSKGYGMANYEKNIPNKRSTRFAIASITKQFTAMAIMQLYEKGKLKLEDKLSVYFPDFPRGDEITIHHLLTHTSGIVNYTNLPEYWSLQPENVTEDVLIDLFIDKPLEFNPGEKWSYSNSGYLLLGVIVEKITGKSLEDYLHKNIFVPLKMHNTDVCFKKDKIALKTVGYVGYLDIEPIDDTLTMKGLYGAGFLYSTLEDLYKWDIALYTNKLVSRETMDLVFAPHTDTKVLGYYGYGWLIQGEGKNKEIFHDGALLGFSSIISRFPERNTGIIVLSNNNPIDSGVYRIKSDINSILLGQEVELPKEKKVISLDSEKIDCLTGTYEVYPGVNFIIIREGSHVYAQITGQEKAEIFPESETEFFYRIADAQITFIKNENGKTLGLILHQSGMDIPARKVADAEVEPSKGQMLDIVA